MGPNDKWNDETFERQLAAAHDAFPDRDIIRAGSGLIAVPKGTEVIVSWTLDGIIKKLRELGESE